jgi:hypothetical protein
MITKATRMFVYGKQVWYRKEMRGKLTAVSPSTIECFRMSFFEIFSAIHVFLFIGNKTMILFNEVNEFIHLRHTSRVKLFNGRRTSKLMLAQNKFYLKYFSVTSVCRYQWLRSLKRRSVATSLMRSWVGAHLGHGCLFHVSVVCWRVEVPARGWSLVNK